MRTYFIRLFILLGLLFPALASAADSWATKAPLPAVNYAAAAAGYNGLLYVAGGTDYYCNAYSSLEAYDPLTDTWTAKASMPTARWSLGAGFVNGILYTVGGANACVTPNYGMNTVEAYDPASNTWTTRASLPTTRHSSGVGVVNGILYVVGGAYGFTALSTVDAYDPTANTWTAMAPMPTARASVSVGVVNGILYAVGGMDGLGPSAAVEAYDPATDTWATMASIPTPRNGLGVEVINGILYAVGGAGGTELSTVEAYDPVTNTWATMTSMPTARAGFSVGVVNNILYAVGGAASNIPLATNEAYDSGTTTVPVLSHSTEPGYGAVGVSPATGTTSTTFTYKVVYTHAADTAPSLVAVCIDAHPCQPMAVDGSAAAALQDGYFTNGEQLAYSTTLALGPHTYYFTASDGVTLVDLPTSGTLSGPTVNYVDLRVSALSSPSVGGSVYTGGPITINDTVMNGGTWPTTYWLGILVTYRLGGALIGSRKLPNLAAGATNTLSHVHTLTASFAPGVYQLTATVDPNNYQTESNEGNNTMTVGLVTVVRDVDLVSNSLGTAATDVYRGATLTLSDTVANIGNSPTSAPVGFRVNYYLSKDATITAADTLLSGRNITRIAAGASNTASKTVSIPAGMAPGVYYLGEIVDSGKAQPESNEANNTRATAGTVTVH